MVTQRPMVDKKKRKECESEGCTIVPVFNYQGESSGRFCKAHRWGPLRSQFFLGQHIVYNGLE